VKFEDQVQQRWHYKLDWHRYNLKQKLNGLESIKEEKFMQLAGLSITFGSEYLGKGRKKFLLVVLLLILLLLLLVWYFY
jgi:hypothetical protein